MLEEKTYRLLIDRKIIKGKGMLVDATVFPENIIVLSLISTNGAVLPEATVDNMIFGKP